MDTLKNVKVLVVEDDRDTREMVQFILKQNGAAVVAAASYAEAIDAYERLEPNVLVTDIGMPDYNGYALIAKVRAEDKRLMRKTPAIALTAFTSDADRDTALASGFDEYMAKPFDPAELVSNILKLV